MKVAVIGGGASGLIASYHASQNGHIVYLFERQSRVGRKLMATGNGRCNLSNLNTSVSHYHGKNPSFVEGAFSFFDVNHTMKWFQSLGLLLTTEDSGKVYPFTDQATSVLDVLRLTCLSSGVTIHTDTEISSIEKRNDSFCLNGNNQLIFDKVIVACGGAAGSHLSGTSLGYELLKNLGHHYIPIEPSLVQIKTDNTYVKSLKGIRCNATVFLMEKEKEICRNIGEIQFTEYGISGPSVFEISRYVSKEKGKQYFNIDFLPEYNEKSVAQILLNRKKQMPNELVDNFLVGLVHNRIGRTIERSISLDGNKLISSLSGDDINAIARSLKQFYIPIFGKLGFENAQVTAGGIDVSDFNPNTLESNIIKGLYACGEVLDIDGDCGGYNLQWAWSSGYLAGLLLQQ